MLSREQQTARLPRQAVLRAWPPRLLERHDAWEPVTKPLARASAAPRAHCPASPHTHLTLSHTLTPSRVLGQTHSQLYLLCDRAALEARTQLELTCSAARPAPLVPGPLVTSGMS